MLVQDTSPGPRRERPAAETGPAPFAADPFDTAQHVNNAVHWAALEDVIAGLGGGRPPPSSSTTGPSGRGRTRAC